MNVQLLRNATLVVQVNGKTILVDPMLGARDSYDPIPYTDNGLRNPLVDLPINEAQLQALIGQTDAILLTHLHIDHWDPAAQQMLPKQLPVFCQPVDAETIRASGFTNVIPVTDELCWEGITIYRSVGRHGVGAITQLTGAVSGYVITAGEERLYIAGDSIWCDEVAQTLDRFRPNRIVLNGSAARFVIGDPIIMNIADVITVCKYAPLAQVYVVHMESVNPSTESRADVKTALADHSLSHRCHVPDDGAYLFK
ncbi:MBL fold metallo-hydrolase [Chitinophaga agrisoli]|nr:MBL fold metallo-hydrolase [Chitinophaga agrisoli]